MKRSTLSIILAGCMMAGGALSFAVAQEPETRQGGKMGHHGKRMHMAERLAEFDTNEDGKLTKEEISAGREAHFRAADANQDGSLTQAEMKAFKDAMREAKRQERENERFIKVDVDGSGGLSLEEFLAARPDNFDRMDRNDDGFLSAEDFEGRRKGPGKWKDRSAADKPDVDD